MIMLIVSGVSIIVARMATSWQSARQAAMPGLAARNPALVGLK
jgi:hypothetical protein